MQPKNLNKNLPKNLVLFDGVCMLCNNFILQIIKMDKEKSLQFCELQSAKGLELLKKHGLAVNDFETIYFLTSTRLYEKSDAILMVLRVVGKPWSFLSIFLMTPLVIRNLIYDLIAQNRHRIYSPRKTCTLPQKKYTERIYR